MLIRERIFEFLKRENKTSAQFADEIGVQPSGISHILSGRNNPSLDFVIKMLEKYPYLSSDWLLFGKGQMFKEQFTGTLFDDLDLSESLKNPVKMQVSFKEEEYALKNPAEMPGIIAGVAKKDPAGIKKIVWFYEDNSFEEFIPLKD